MLRRISVILTLFVLVGLVPSATPASAYGFFVDSTVDLVDAHPGDGLCRTAANTCTLRAAVMEANVHTGSHTIVLPLGVFTFTIGTPWPPDGPEDTDANGDLDIRGNITILGHGISTTHISANRMHRIFQVAPQGSLTLANMTLRDGLAPTNTPPAAGGAILSQGPLSLTDVEGEDCADHT